MTYPNFNLINCAEKLEQISYFLNKQNLTDEEKFKSIFMVCKGRNETQKKYHLKDIEDFVCQFSGLTIDQINQRTKKAEIVQMRQISHYLAHRLTTETLLRIGLHFGNRDHSTVLNSIKVVKNDLKSKVYREKFYDFICNPEEYLKIKNEMA